MDSTPTKMTLLLEANLRFLSANLQLNSLVLNTLNNTDALDENQSVLNNLLNWLKSLSQLEELSQGEQVLIDSLKDSVRKAKSYDFVIDNKINPKIINSALNENKTLKEFKKDNDEGITNTTEETETLYNQENPEENDEKGDKIDQSEIEASFLYRLPGEIQDRWDYLANIQSFITSYEHLMHLLMPNLVFEVVNELHRYDGQNKLIVSEAISYPSVILQNMVTKFLREAPGSNLFRRIRRIKIDNDVDLKSEQAVNIGERRNIKSIVDNYIKTLTNFLDPNSEVHPQLETFADQTKMNVKQFSLGPASVEMRLTAVIKHSTESALNDAIDVMQNENASLKTKIIYLATTQLICDFQNFLLGEPRIVKFLEDLKS